MNSYSPAPYLSWNISQSPFASAIHTNYVPSAEDLVHLDALLAQPQLQLMQLESEIARLSREKEIVQKYVEAHRALMSPIRRLPAETLSEIFTHCLPEDRYAVRSVAEAPLLLTTISRGWRRTALDTPSLWRSLHIFLPSRLSSESLQKRVAGSILWLDRARALPIFISFYRDAFERQIPPNDDTLLPNSILGGFVDVLMKFNSGIKELTFTGSNFDRIAGHLDSLLALRNFPILDMFRIRSTGDMIRLGELEDPDLPFASLVQRMPALKKLWIDGFFHHPRQYSQLQLDWEHLTELTIQPLTSRFGLNFSGRELLNMLAHTPRLQSLTFTIVIGNWELGNVVNLPAMRDLRLVFEQRDVLPENMFFQNFFSSIACPALKALHLSQHGAAMPMHILLSSLVSLQEVETLLLDMPMTPNSLLESLSLFPNLRSFEIHGRIKKVDGDESQGILPSFAHNIDNSVLVHLGCNTFSVDGPALLHGRASQPPSLDESAQITNDALLTFLEKRVQMKTLQTCDVFFPEPRSESTEEDLRRIQALLNSGLKLRIRYAKLRPLKYDDSPVAGAWMLSGLGSQITSRAGNVQSDMEGRFGTGIVI
ncbi:hypothetical protein BT96DRAFT_921386 [Gymnopus androsaceus JB14]|uniref:Uncharacterized protein n=1 Tax=Gymnopus androsaceus JB14 TaxID=1447944 RepID=A0A6A4HJ44_9AGAR|nr:hypothetical protein BT96DRAFT_921386 [Gymnopus androsaceus JB14]